MPSNCNCLEATGSLKKATTLSTQIYAWTSDLLVIGLESCIVSLQVVAFCDKLVPFPMPKNESLVSVLKRAQKLPFGGTDCSLPIRHAINNNLDVDVFVVMTDNETCETNPTPPLKTTSIFCQLQFA